ncbi:hypothetical protein DID88_005013 [Monilinia fructigena]|uniref:Uncharacterized protein n=1 Tax=Monilinia fructigena TaxID=38457 RepID=A0A395IQ88_9HELO|nr:hypothetical protein DID88_005013 [Monilinia fructigena]
MAESSLYPTSFLAQNTDQIIDGEAFSTVAKNVKLHIGQSIKTDCRSLFMKKSWRPQWDVENRRPAFIGGSNDGASIEEWVTMVQHGRKKYLWGNVPAIDMVQSSKNEGKEFPEQFNLLFHPETSEMF